MVTIGRVRRFILNNKGQGTIEFAIIASVLLVVVIGLWMLLNAISGGLFLEHATNSASHALTENTAGATGDIILY